MRERVERTVKEKRVIVNPDNYDERALKLNGYVDFDSDKRGIIQDLSNCRKGNTSYGVWDQSTFDLITTVNDEVRCALVLSSPIESFHFPRLKYIYIDKDNLKYYLNLSFGRIDCLWISSLSDEEMCTFLAKVKKVDCLMLSKINLGCDLFAKCDCQRGYIGSSKIKDKVTLSTLKYVRIHKGEGWENLNLPNLVELVFQTLLTVKPESVALIPRLKRFVGWETNFPAILPYLPKTIVSLEYDGREKVDFEPEFMPSHPKLIQIDLDHFRMRTSSLKEHQMFDFNCRMIDDTDEKLSARFKKVTIDMYNDEAINNHPELLENCFDIYLVSTKLNLDWVAEGIERIKIFKCDFEGYTLNRTEEKRL